MSQGILSSTLYANVPGADNIETFLRQLLKAQGIYEPKFTAEEVDKYLLELAEVFEQYLTTALVSKLTEEQAQKLSTMEEGASLEQQMQFLSSAIPDLQNKMLEILTEFAQIYLGIEEKAK